MMGKSRKTMKIFEIMYTYRKIASLEMILGSIQKN